MLASSFRLKKKEIEQLFKKGKVFRKESLDLRIISNRVLHPRFAIIIPKKVSAKASARNRLKRQAMIILSSLDKIKSKNFDLAIFFKEIPAEERLKSLLTEAIYGAIGKK